MWICMCIESESVCMESECVGVESGSLHRKWVWLLESKSVCVQKQSIYV